MSAASGSGLRLGTACTSLLPPGPQLPPVCPAASPPTTASPKPATVVWESPRSLVCARISSQGPGGRGGPFVLRALAHSLRCTCQLMAALGSAIPHWTRGRRSHPTAAAPHVPLTIGTESLAVSPLKPCPSPSFLELAALRPQPHPLSQRDKGILGDLPCRALQFSSSVWYRTATFGHQMPCPCALRDSGGRCVRWADLGTGGCSLRGSLRSSL